MTGNTQEVNEKFVEQKSNLHTSSLFSIKEGLRSLVKACDGPVLGKRSHEPERDTEVDSQRPCQYARTGLVQTQAKGQPVKQSNKIVKAKAKRNVATLPGKDRAGAQSNREKTREMSDTHGILAAWQPQNPTNSTA